jgi:hypothetical protein
MEIKAESYNKANIKRFKKPFLRKLESSDYASPEFRTMLLLEIHKKPSGKGNSFTKKKWKVHS